MKRLNKPGIIKRAFIGGLASVLGLSVQCAPNDLQRRVDTLEQQVSQLTEIQNQDFYFVNGNMIKGTPQGPKNGRSVVVQVTPEDQGTNCVNGGYKIEFFRDDNNNGVKDSNETMLLGTAYSCTGNTGPQGLQGMTGATGATGEQGPIGLQGEQGLTGERGLTGEQGPIGPQGEMGRSLVTEIMQESSGYNCSNGGYRINFFKDDNNDGIKQAEETTLIGTAYSCKGDSGEDFRIQDTSAPIASIVSIPKQGNAPLEVAFISEAHDPESGIASYSWYFNNDDVEDSNKGVDVFTYQNGGTFRPRLTVTNGAGLSTTVEGLEIIVNEVPTPTPLPTPTPVPCDPYIDTIVRESPGTYYEDTSHILGAPDWTGNECCSLGSPGGNGGWTIFGFTNNVARDISGPDLRFWGTTNYSGETADVYVSNDLSNFVFIGSISDENFIQDLDFGGSGLPEIKYIKLIGTSSDGVDIDAIEALDGCP